ncbi:MAG: transposase [Limisphaerales bacterium]
MRDLVVRFNAGPARGDGAGSRIRLKRDNLAHANAPRDQSALVVAPAWAAVTEARFAILRWLDQLPLQSGVTCVLDFGCFDFLRLARREAVAGLHRCRWQAELSFKWNEQHLRGRAFLSRNENAGRLQAWSAICAGLLKAVAGGELGLPPTRHHVLPVVSVSVFELVPLTDLSSPPASITTPTNEMLLVPWPDPGGPGAVL